MEMLSRDSPLASKTVDPDTADRSKTPRRAFNNYGCNQDVEAARETDSDTSFYTEVDTDIDTDTDTDADTPRPRRPNKSSQSASTSRKHNREWKDDEDQKVTRTDAAKDKFKPTATLSSNTASDSDSGLKLSPPGAADDDDELFSPNRVDQLVASFWSKVDQKIDAAISSRQSDQRDQQYASTSPSEETGPSRAHSAATEEEGKEEDEDKNVSRASAGVCLLFVSILQSIGRIFTLCSQKAKDNSKGCFTAGSENSVRDELKVLLTHRYTHLIIVMLTVFDFVLVMANILSDFHAINGRGMEDIFSGFLQVNVAILFVFVFETLTKMIVFRRDLFWDVMETFDTILVAFYFLAETIASGGFRNITAPYAEYLHVAVILRLWRVCFLIEELQQTREEALNDVEHGLPSKQDD